MSIPQIKAATRKIGIMALNANTNATAAKT
jgi:hypothetical protein